MTLEDDVEKVHGEKRYNELERCIPPISVLRDVSLQYNSQMELLPNCCIGCVRCCSIHVSLKATEFWEKHLQWCTMQ